MQLRSKVVLLAVVPLILAAGILAVVVSRQSSALARSQIDELDQILTRAKQDELRDLMKLARTAIPELDGWPRDDDETRGVLERLRGMDFGEDGYFYVYDMHGFNLMHPRRQELEGNDQWTRTDDRGQPIIQQLIQEARDAGDGGGFVRYRWQRPSQQQSPPQSEHDWEWRDKLGYVVHLPKRDWMIGTGIYLDDIGAIKETTQQIQASSTAAVGHTLLLIAVVALLAVLVVAALGGALNVSQQRLADAKLRKLTWQLVAAEEQERARVARYLHDEALQDLLAVKVVVETALLEPKQPPLDERLAAMLEQSLASLTQSADQIRTVSHGLRPQLQGDGLPALLEQTAAAFSRRTGLPATVDAPAVPQLLSAEAATALFRITQQALDNVHRHARATRVEIRLAPSRRWLSAGTSLIVSDDGRGFDVAAVGARTGGGIGLLNMRERIEAIGGRLFLRSGPNGTEVEAFLPSEAPRKGEGRDHSDDATT